MTDPVDGSEAPPITPEGQVAAPSPDATPAAPANPASAQAAAALSLFQRLDAKAQLGIGSGLAVAVIGLVGSIVDAWSLQFSGLILILAGLGAAAATYWATTRPESTSARFPLRDLILAGGVISAILGILYLIQVIFDIGDLTDDYGGVLGLIAVVALAVAGVALYWAASRWWEGGPLAPWTTAIRSGGRPTQLVLGGAGLVVVGWAITMLIGFWFLEAGSEVITFILLAALVMRAAGDPDQPLRLPFPPVAVALAFSVLGAIIALQHTTRMLGDADTELNDWIPQAIYVIGVALAVVGSGLGTAEALGATNRKPAAPSSGGPAA